MKHLTGKIRVTPGCWLWTAGKTGPGYGQLLLGSKPMLAHRYSYELYVGSIPKGMVVRHKCDTRSCVNPDHLELGTVADNNRDMIDRGRAAWQNQTHCKHNHEYTPENTRHHNGQRFCRACDRERSRKRRANA